MNQELIHLMLESAVTAGLTICGFIGSRIVHKLDILDKHEVKLQVHDEKLMDTDRRLQRIEDKQ